MAGIVLGFAVAFGTPTETTASHQAYYDHALATGPGVDGAGRVQTDFWNSLTPEQQTIHRTVTQLYTLYFQKNGQVLPVTRETVALVMKEFDIAAEHTEWTAYVMQVNVQRLRAR
jgi:hypothetical protein